MAFVVYCEKEHINKKRAKDIQPDEQKNIFYCQNIRCNCKFTVSALNSSRVRTHFVKLPSSEHIVGCWNNVNLSDSGDKDDYDTSDFSPLSLLSSIQKVEDKKVSDEKRKTFSHEVSGNTTGKQTLHIHTIRQLYSVCMMNDEEEEINGIKIKEIFAGQKTSYLYTKYISGIKLVECSYYCYDTKRNEIKFQFPYTENSFRVSICFDSIELFKKLRRQLFDYTRPILIYAEWNNNQAKITSQKQIVPLR